MKEVYLAKVEFEGEFEQLVKGKTPEEITKKIRKDFKPGKAYQQRDFKINKISIITVKKDR